MVYHIGCKRTAAPSLKMSVEKPMKKLLLASAVAALSTTAAQAAPQVYGKAFLTLDLNKGNTDYTNTVNTVTTDASGKVTSVTKTVTGKKSADGRSKLNSNSSRIGFKGSETLTANTDLVYKLEYGIDVDAETGKQFRAKETYLGLTNKQFGTLLAGRIGSIDGIIDYATVAQGGVLGGYNVLAGFDAPYANNTFAYVSPNYNGVNFLGMYVLDENNSTDNLKRDAFGVGVQYEPENASYRAGTTYVQSGNLKAARVSGAFDLSPATTVNALYQNTKFTKNGKKENAFAVSAEHKLVQTPWTAYGQVDIVNNAKGFKGGEKQRLVLGTKYAFNPNTTGHIYGADRKSVV